MKKIIFLLGLLALAAAVGFVMGTENGRQQRDRVVAKVREARKGAGDATKQAADAVGDAAVAAADAVVDAADPA